MFVVLKIQYFTLLSKYSIVYKYQVLTMGDDEDSESGKSEIDLLSISREEAHRTIDKQVSTLNDIDTKAVKILRLNLLLLSIILTGFSIVGRTGKTQTMSAVASQFGNEYVVAGLISILLSTALAALTYTASSMREGPSGDDIDQLLYGDFTDRQKLYGLVSSYAEWTRMNFKTNTKNAPLGTATVAFLVYGIVSLATGVYGILSSGVPWWLTLGVVICLAIFTWQTGIYGQIQRYRRNRN